MRKINQIVIAFLFLTILSCNKSDEKNGNQQINCLPTNLQNGVVAFYPFSSGSLNDYSGNNYNLTNPTTAIPGEDRGGNPNCAFNFIVANNDFLQYTNPSFLDDLPANGLSISFWYKSNNQVAGIFMSRDEGNFCSFTIGQWSINHINNVLSFAANARITSSYGVQTTAWQHIVITAQGSSLQFYKDGILVNTSGSTSFCSQLSLNQGNLFIGKQFDGLMDDIIIYDRIITPTEVAQLYNLTACCN